MNSEYDDFRRKRARKLLIVEGVHEKDILFSNLFRCYPELKITEDNIWVYGTDIYQLYRKITKEYGEKWFKDELSDVDLPFLLSKNTDDVCSKNDFTNIILVFDYERQDPYFSEEIINNMVTYFSDSTDVGKLYINYPMIESYMDIHCLQRDDEYQYRKISSNYQLGTEYKETVKNTIIAKNINLPIKIEKVLKEQYSLSEHETTKKVKNAIFEVSSYEDIEKEIKNCLNEELKSAELNRAIHQFEAILKEAKYLDNHMPYWDSMRMLFKMIIIQNICKANMIQNNEYEVAPNNLKNTFNQIDLSKILNVQNELCRDKLNGYIWVLNTCLFLIPDYNFKLIM